MILLRLELPWFTFNGLVLLWKDGWFDFQILEFDFGWYQKALFGISIGAGGAVWADILWMKLRDGKALW